MHVVELAATGGFEAIVAGVAALVDPSGGPCMVALDGRSGVGKSTLAARLATATGATVIDGDDFFAGGVELRRDPPDRRAAACIDWRRQREVLTTLREGRAAKYLAFDWDAFDGRLESAPTVVEAAPLVILEGVYAARPELADLIDLRVLLRVPDDVRLRRLEAREGGIGESERAWHEAEEWYFANAARETSFDVVVHGGAMHAR
jgi:uridine kinase